MLIILESEQNWMITIVSNSKVSLFSMMDGEGRVGVEREEH